MSIIVFFLNVVFFGFFFSKIFDKKISITSGVVVILIYTISLLLHENDFLDNSYFFIAIFLGWLTGAIFHSIHKRRENHESKKN